MISPRLTKSKDPAIRAASSNPRRREEEDRPVKAGKLNRPATKSGRAARWPASASEGNGTATRRRTS